MRPTYDHEPFPTSFGDPLPHESAHLHVCGEARYIDDIPEPKDTLHAAIGISERAHARIKAIDLSPVFAAEGVVDIMAAADVPGKNDFGPIIADDPIFAKDEVRCVGQSIFVVAAETVEQARRAARLAKIDYEELPSIFDLDEAVEKESFVIPTKTLARGNSADAITRATHRLRGRFRIGGQEQFYLEGHIAMAIPQEDGQMLVYSSTQHPGEVQHQVADALGVRDHNVVVHCRRMGGGFGGKETQPALFACIAALLANSTGRAIKLRLDRDDDITMTGKRHDFNMDYDVGFDDDGRIRGIEFVQSARAGMSADLTGPVADRAVFHSDNCYFLENVKIISHRCKTNTVSNTAFRGFGGPQGMLAIEHVIDEIARYLQKDPLEVRRTNFYGVDERNVTPYQMKVEDNIIHDIVDQLEKSSNYRRRRQEIDQFNATSKYLKRGIALTPVKFGISFTATHYNQAGALINVYHTDGSVILNHGGTEMGQGLFTKVAQVVAGELEIDISKIRCSASDTSKVPNASATAASSGSDLNGMAAQAAARTIKNRLIGFAAETYNVSPDDVVFNKGTIQVGTETLSWEELVNRAYHARVSLSAAGYYRTPKIHYDLEKLAGRPFYYFAYGAAVSEVIVDILTGEHKLLQVDILHDVGKSINPAIDLGQVEGGFIQGMGWLTSEELWWDKSGRLMTHAPSTYKIPVCSDWPEKFNVKLLATGQNREETIHRSKAVGEPPLMLANSVFFAIKDAIASVADHQLSPSLDTPATPERVLMTIQSLKQQRSVSRQTKKVATPTPVS